MRNTLFPHLSTSLHYITSLHHVMTEKALLTAIVLDLMVAVFCFELHMLHSSPANGAYCSVAARVI
jgi:hypothetical protein